MHLEFMVEEESAEAALNNLIPKIVGTVASYKIHAFQGKQDLLTKLPDRMRGYNFWLPLDWRIVVLIDEDRGDCIKLKTRLEQIAQKEGLITRSKAGAIGNFQVLNRIAIEELEAWFFGDVAAICAEYSRVPRTLDMQKKYRNPDAIQGGTWEALERVLQRANYYLGGLPKVEVARKVSAHMDPNRNISKSFQVFRDALKEVVLINP